MSKPEYEPVSVRPCKGDILVHPHDVMRFGALVNCLEVVRVCKRKPRDCAWKVVTNSDLHFKTRGLRKNGEGWRILKRKPQKKRSPK